MRQAIEEGFILDVLQNYTSYQVLYQLQQQQTAPDRQVDARRAAVKLTQWARLHPHNIATKIAIIIDHFYHNVAGLLDGHAKAMVVTASRKSRALQASLRRLHSTTRLSWYSCVGGVFW